MNPVDYSTLESLLSKQQWKEADQETFLIMRQILPNPDQPDKIGDMSQFSCDDLQKIDQLWVKYSQEKFGFSVQKNLWESLGGQLDETQSFNEALFNDTFAINVGWNKDGNLLTSENLDYSLNAPKGQLPAKWANSETIVASKIEIYKAWQRLKFCSESTHQSFPNSTIPPAKLNQAIVKLTEQLQKELTYRQKHHIKNRNTYLFLSITSIFFTCLATIFGIIGGIDTGETINNITNQDGQETTQVVQEPQTFLKLKRTDWWRFLTPICTTLAATFQGALLGFPIQQRVKLHRTLAAQTDALNTELEIQQFLGASPEYIQEISKKLSEIKLTSANEDGEANGKISTLTIEQINAVVAEMTKLRTELDNLKTAKTTVG